MISHLEDLERRFAELSQMLSSPEVISNAAEFQKLSREYADLKDLVEGFQSYQRAQQECAEIKELLEGSEDPEMREVASQEYKVLEEKRNNLWSELQILLLPKDPYDTKNTILEIRAGTGGEEAALFASSLLRAYLRYAENTGWTVEFLTKSETGLGGLKEASVLIQGRDVYSKLKFEGGVHRVQRVPETEAGGRIHTSAVTVAILPEAEEVDVNIQEKDLRIDVMRAGGPGGQSVNTTDSAVRITHLPTNTVVVCQDEKSQHKNKAKAMKVLLSRLLEKEIEKQHAEQSSTRKSMVGSGDRSERIRTYNFPQNRVTDHRIGLTLHKLDSVMEGDFDALIAALRTSFQAELLKNASFNTDS